MEPGRSPGAVGDLSSETRRARSTRGGFVKAGGLALFGATAAGIGGTGIAHAATTASAAVPGTSILDKWLSTKKATLGVDLSFPPLQYKDPKTGKPTGYMMALTQQMMSDLGVTPTYVETPFAQLFAALAAGKFDMVGIAATILPTRAESGWFAGIPCFYESNVIVVNSGFKGSGLASLKNARFAVLQGSSQQATGQLLFPKAKFTSFATETDAATQVSVGRADAAIYSEYSAATAVTGTKNLKILKAPPLFVDANTYFMPKEDIILREWVTNWLRYQTTHRLLEGLWQKWIVPEIKKYHLYTTPVGINGAANAIRT